MRNIKETEKRKTDNPVSIVRSLTLLLSGLLILTGLLIVVDPGSCIWFSGILLILFGLVRWSGYYIKDLYNLAYQFDFEFGILMIVAGIMIFMEPGIIKFYGAQAVEILILAEALFRIRICKQARKFGIETWWLTLVLALITSVLSITAVSLTVLYSKWSLTALGICLVAEGCLNCCIGLTMVSTLQGSDIKQKEREIE